MSQWKMQTPEWANYESDSPLNRDYLVVAQGVRNLADVNRLYYAEAPAVAMVPSAQQAQAVSPERAAALNQLRRDREQEVVDNARTGVAVAYNTPNHYTPPVVMTKPVFEMPVQPIDHAAVGRQAAARQTIDEIHYGPNYERLASEPQSSRFLDDTSYPIGALDQINEELHREDKQVGMV